MAKNNALINQYKRLGEQKQQLRNEIDQVTPEVYAAFALVLHESYGWRHKRIAKLFELTADKWAECVDKGVIMSKECLEVANIDVIRVVNDKDG